MSYFWGYENETPFWGNRVRHAIQMPLLERGAKRPENKHLRRVVSKDRIIAGCTEGRNLKARVREELIRGSGLKRNYRILPQPRGQRVREELIRGSGLKQVIVPPRLRFTSKVREELIRGSGLKLKWPAWR